MSEPYEIIMSPFEVYLAPVGETFPDPDTTPGGNWELLGTNGKRNQSDDGISVEHNQTINKHRNAGSTGPIKAVRSEEDLTISFMLEDLSVDEYAKVINDQTVSTVAAGAAQIGTKEFPLHQGTSVSTFALLCRGVSPEGDSWNSQYEVPVVFQDGNPTPSFKKNGDAAGLECKFVALEDPDAATESERFGKFIAQNANATS